MIYGLERTMLVPVTQAQYLKLSGEVGRKVWRQLRQAGGVLTTSSARSPAVYL